MIIKIDCREGQLIDLLNQKTKPDNIEIIKENLAIGDIIINDISNNNLVIIERKTVADLASSILDGRYKEQSFRLSQNELHNHNIFYLIEGNLQNKQYSKNINNATLLSAIFSLNYCKGFSVHRTFSIQETADYILQIAVKLSKHDNQSYYNTDNMVGNQNIKYSQVIKPIKKDNVNSENISEIMLSQIPNVSINVATKLVEKYGNLKTLISNLENNPNLLDDFKIEGKEGKFRKINKTCISNIYKYLINLS